MKRLGWAIWSYEDWRIDPYLVYITKFLKIATQCVDINIRIPLWNVMYFSIGSQFRVFRSSLLGVFVRRLMSRIVLAAGLCSFHNLCNEPIEESPQIINSYPKIGRIIVWKNSLRVCSGRNCLIFLMNFACHFVNDIISVSMTCQLWINVNIEQFVVLYQLGWKIV